jgi:hypothetical protein
MNPKIGDVVLRRAWRHLSLVGPFYLEVLEASACGILLCLRIDAPGYRF